MKIKYIFDVPEYNYYAAGREVLKNEYYSLVRVHETELEMKFYDNKQVEHRVYVVVRDDGKIIHLESNTEEFEKDGVDPYVAALLYVIREDMKRDLFDMVDGNYLEFFNEHYPLKKGDEGVTKSKYNLHVKSYRYRGWMIAIYMFLGIGLITSIIFIIMYTNRPEVWASNIGFYLLLAGIMFIINIFLERKPDNFFIKGKETKEDDE